MRRRFLIFLGLLSLASCAAINGFWMDNVPLKEQKRPNPFAADPRAALAGAKLFDENCSQCHGRDAGGKGGKPSLRTMHVQDATPGQLQWLLRNGSLKNGMPSWARLPENERWQIIAYLKSLK